MPLASMTAPRPGALFPRSNRCPCCAGELGADDLALADRQCAACRARFSVVRRDGRAFLRTWALAPARGVA